MLLFARSRFDWLITIFFWNIGHHPIESTEVLPFSLWVYILGNTLKTCQWNTLGTWWEPPQELNGTHWEQEFNLILKKEKKKHPSLPTQKERKKKLGHPECMSGLSLATWKLWLYMAVCHHFWAWLMEEAKGSMDGL